MPRWVQETSRKYLRKNKLSIDLVGKGSNSVQTSDTIEHLAIRCPYHERASTLADIVHGAWRGQDKAGTGRGRDMGENGAG